MLTPTEFTFVIDCTRIPLNDATVTRIRATLVEGVNWPAILQFSIPHGVLPLIVNAVSLHATDLVAEDLLRPLTRVLAKAEARTRRQGHALAEIMQALDSAGIRTLAYKGPALTALAYADFRLRESHDLDLWADPAKTAHTGEVLVGLGYKPAIYWDKQPRLSTNQDQQHFEFLSADGEIIIDLLDLKLHPQFFFRPDFEAIWSRRQQVTAFDPALPTLGTEDLILALAVHGSKHLWRRLNWVADLAALLASAPQLDWTAMLVRSKHWRCYRRFLTSMALLNQLYGTELSPAIELELRLYKPARRSAAQIIGGIVHSAESRTLKKEISALAYLRQETDMFPDRGKLALSQLLHRASLLPRTVSKRLELTKRTIRLGSWSVDVSLPSLVLKVDLNPDADF